MLSRVRKQVTLTMSNDCHFPFRYLPRVSRAVVTIQAPLTSSANALSFHHPSVTHMHSFIPQHRSHKFIRYHRNATSKKATPKKAASARCPALVHQIFSPTCARTFTCQHNTTNTRSGSAHNLLDHGQQKRTQKHFSVPARPRDQEIHTASGKQDMLLRACTAPHMKRLRGASEP